MSRSKLDVVLTTLLIHLGHVVQHGRNAVAVMCTTSLSNQAHDHPMLRLMHFVTHLGSVIQDRINTLASNGGYTHTYELNQGATVLAEKWQLAECV